MWLGITVALALALALTLSPTLALTLSPTLALTIQVLLVFEEAFWERAEGKRDFWGITARSARERGVAFQFWNMQRCTGRLGLGLGLGLGFRLGLGLVLEHAALHGQADAPRAARGP